MAPVLGLPVGRKAPDFQLPDEYSRVHHLYEIIGKKPVVLYFYSSDFGMMCTVILRDFRDMYDELIKHCVFLPISANTTYSHGAFSDSLHLQFPLLADPHCEVIKEYNLWGIDNDYLGDRSYRALFILDLKGIIRYAWAPDDPSLEPNYDEILEWTRRLDLEG